MNELFEAPAMVSGPVECLGQTFANEDARRQHFLNLLREKLKDPEFRKIAGFPIGTDDAILAMSDPPYYTACPNPFLADFVAQYGKPYDPTVLYSREPHSIDVTVGKTDPLYKAHSYHTKVPHLAIVPSILHYTEPGDVVLDGFAGSGMTGVAAQWCGTAPAAYRLSMESEWKNQGKPAPTWGARRVVLNDLSPAATFITANYNLPFDIDAFANAGKQLLLDVENELGWMYETKHSDGKTKGRIEFTVWSEVFTCPNCAGEVNFKDEALDEETNLVRASFPCPHCGASLNKENLERIMETRVDPIMGKSWSRVKLVPSLISYVVSGKRHIKLPDQNDLELLAKIEALPYPGDIPKVRFPIEQMYHGSRIEPKGFSYVHHFYLTRPVHSLAALWRKAKAQPDVRIREMLLFFIDQSIWGFSVLNRYSPSHFSQVNRALNGVYYIASQNAEGSPLYNLRGKLSRIVKAFRGYKTSRNNAAITTGTTTRLPLMDKCVDYVFTDPPFGENIFYADLNFLVESWHRVTTDSKPEAIVDKFKKKALPEYQHLMQSCFAEYYRVLKPGRWMTVVFSNSKAAVWNSIQIALQQAGFVVAEVTALDKIQGSFRQVTSATAVKQDLIISAYKPNGGLEDRFSSTGATTDSAWDFVRTHLKHLPVVKVTGGDSPKLLHIVERDPRRIYDRMASWFIRHGTMVPISTPEFLAEMAQRFVERDGMFFMPEQVMEYDRKRQLIPQVQEISLFVSDERSAIDWLSDFLKRKPSSYAEVHPEYIPVVGAAKKKGEVIPELGQLLEDNFLQYDGESDVPSQIHSLLSTNFKELRGLEKNDPKLMAKAKGRWYVPDPNKAQDLEKKREKALLKEFETYRAFTGRKLKEFRLEVMRAGFNSAWAKKDYQTIITVSDKIPVDALQEDEKLLTLYDLALTRTEGK
jgi:hypothetical protein